MFAFHETIGFQVAQCAAHHRARACARAGQGEVTRSAVAADQAGDPCDNVSIVGTVGTLKQVCSPAFSTRRHPTADVSRRYPALADPAIANPSLVAPGKPLLAAVRNRIQTEHGTSFGAARLVEEFEVAEIPEELKALLAKVDAAVGPGTKA